MFQNVMITMLRFYLDNKFQNKEVAEITNFRIVRLANTQGTYGQYLTTWSSICPE